MLIHTLKQLCFGVLVIFLAVSLTFFMVRLNGDPTSQILPEEAPQEQRDALKRELGLDKPLPAQYVEYMWRAAQGDFGRSYFDSDPVATVVSRRLPATFLLATAALMISMAIALPLGLLSAVWQGGWVDRFAQTVAVLGASLPTFWIGLMLIQVFSVSLAWLPTYGSGTAQHLVLPALTLALYVIPSVTRLTRASMLDILPAPYVTSARAKGMPESRVVLRTVARNGIVPVLALIAIEMGHLFGGAVLTETVFSWPGIGRLAIEAIQRRDFPIVQGVVAYVAVIFVVISVLADMAARIANPRLRDA